MNREYSEQYSGNAGKWLILAVLCLGLVPLTVRAEIDGHGPDAWRVTGVAPDDVLNARMGPRHRISCDRNLRPR